MANTAINNAPIMNTHTYHWIYPDCNLCNAVGNPVGNGRQHIHRAIDDMTIEPCDRPTNSLEYHFMSHPHIELVHIESMISRRMQSTELIGKSFGFGIFREVHPCSQSDSRPLRL